VPTPHGLIRISTLQRRHEFGPLCHAARRVFQSTVVTGDGRVDQRCRALGLGTLRSKEHLLGASMMKVVADATVQLATSTSTPISGTAIELKRACPPAVRSDQIAYPQQ